jgi:superfamily II DNA helicase RecQ
MEVLQKEDVKDVLKKYFGFDEFRGRQEEVVRHLLNGQNPCAISFRPL